MTVQIPDPFGAFAGGFTYGRDLKRQREERERAEAMQTLQTILQMQGTGAARASDVTAFIEANKERIGPALAGMQVQKLGPEMRQDITQGTTMNVPVSAAFGTSIPVPMAMTGKAVTSDMRRNAGLPSYEQMEMERLGVTGARQQTELGGHAVAIGREEQTPQATQARALQRIKDIVSGAAPGYVDKAINRVGGWKRLVQADPKTKSTPEMVMQLVGDEAYNDFLKNSSLGQLDAGQQQFVKSVMQTAALDRQLQAVDLQARMLEAQYRLSMGSGDPLSRMMDDVAKRLDQNLKDRQETEQLYGHFEGMAEVDILKLDPSFRHGIAKLRRLRTEELNLKTAQSRLARGDMNISHLLESPTQSAERSGITGEMPNAPEEDIQAAIDHGKRLPFNQRQGYINNLPVNEADRQRIIAGIKDK